MDIDAVRHTAAALSSALRRADELRSMRPHEAPDPYLWSILHADAVAEVHRRSSELVALTGSNEVACAINSATDSLLAAERLRADLMRKADAAVNAARLDHEAALRFALRREVERPKIEIHLGMKNAQLVARIDELESALRRLQGMAHVF